MSVTALSNSIPLESDVRFFSAVRRMRGDTTDHDGGALFFNYRVPFSKKEGNR
ncbi:hypothetical protein OWP15_27445 [Bacillus paranthracis]|uniref:hypothetical protein n=1 Tax=Bacillus paranthracis TaxID=2026186 RepID=UPI0021119E7E|nr:hypothetical protein [Bacillus paranthracis]HDR7970084.1 hypothetical protein [Bacillus pacificus]HDR8323830.1 hypothetical protein [Bacillus cereus]MCQ6525298.1 hypothetical protein [Bacillus paranthracis]MDK7476384.1 hypothetical protein [Bacillus paranthracis]HDR8330527.1 hypothetical protein [Bacillus cereus]